MTLQMKKKRNKLRNTWKSFFLYQGSPMFIISNMKMHASETESSAQLFCFLGTLSWGRPVDLSWVDVDSLQASIAVIKDSPKDGDWMASDLENNINDFVEINKNIFIQFESKPLHEPSTTEINDSMSEIVLSTVSTSKSIAGVLMNKANSFPKGKQNASLGLSKQYNAIVNYIIFCKFGVKASCLTDYEKLVKYSSELLWEIDPHYH